MPLRDPVTVAYREKNLALRAEAMKDLNRIWPELQYANLDGSFRTWLANAGSVVRRDRARAADLAADYLKAHRAQVGFRDEALVELVTEIAAAQLDTALYVTTVVAVKKSTALGKDPTRAMIDAFVMSSGAATRLILDAGRDTVTKSSIADPSIAGWKRVGTGRCDFCRMLIGRGAVYREASASFQSHDHCTCTAEPEYR